MTKSAGLEGTAIIAHDWEDRLRKDLTENIVEEGKKMMQDISVVKEGVIAGKIGVTAMHDVTEGGLLGALWELCEASKVGTLIDREKINIAPATKEICEFFNLDPLRLISSGCMLITVAPEKAPELLAEYEKNKIVATVIGKITASGRFIQDRESISEILPPVGDELYKVF